jgi:histidinol dehydrogenase
MMQINNPKEKDWPTICKRPVVNSQDLARIVETIFAAVQERGDSAIRSYTKQFDRVVVDSLVVSNSDLDLAALTISDDLRQAVDIAYDNILAFHERQRLDIAKEMVEKTAGVLCWRESRAIERVGLYVPGGSVPLVSTALMLGIPAKLAGCKEIVLATPPNPDGSVAPAICYVAKKIGATKVIRAGGIQAIAGMTLGTMTIPKVDKLFGPGNQYVTVAKQYAVNLGTAIDMPAGPSEVLVLADERAIPAFVAADLLSQAEHGPDSQVVLVTTSKTIASAVEREITRQLAVLPRKAIAAQALENSFRVVFNDLQTALRFTNTYAPEHAILSVTKSRRAACSLQNAGSVFLGNYSPESAGDYASGTNHTLPTNGWARSYGGLSLDSFTKKITFQELSKEGLASLAPTIETLARAEGLEAHARAVSVRFNMETCFETEGIGE